jgi:hypothetical protein
MSLREKSGWTSVGQSDEENRLIFLVYFHAPTCSAIAIIDRRYILHNIPTGNKL